MKTNILLTLLFLTSVTAFSQNLTQTIRGRVIAKQSEVPLPGVNLVALKEQFRKLKLPISWAFFQWFFIVSLFNYRKHGN